MVEGHQYYWDFTYPNGAISVDTLRLPYNRPVRLTIRSADVDHSWWIPALGGKLDAIPGKTNHLTFRATKLGTFAGQCAEFCGLLHAAMLAHVAGAAARPSTTPGSSARANAQLALGKETFVGVCAKCHGLAAQGGVGPDIAQQPAARRQERDLEHHPPGHGQDAGRRQRLVAGAARRDDRVPPPALRKGASGGGQG